MNVPPVPRAGGEGVPCEPDAEADQRPAQPLAGGAARRLEPSSTDPCCFEILSPVFAGELLHYGWIDHVPKVRPIADIMSPQYG